jgi:hypothetical protein
VLDALSTLDRQRLLRFVCSFAWADLRVGPEEKRYVAALIDRLALGESERLEVAHWLRVPPPPEAVDPIAIPREHRSIFLDAIRGVVEADGCVSPEEREHLALFSALLG